jgi:hypothetical protein
MTANVPDGLVISADGRDANGESLIAAMQASPCRDIDIEPERGPMPVREVDL